MKLQTCPGLQQLQQLVEGSLNEETEAAVEDHLSTCESCRSKVEQNIQSADWWQQARSSLRSSSRDADADDSSHAPVDLLSLLGPTDDPEKIGRIAEYEVIGIIGRGGMGVVFKAFDPRLNRFVAIKMLLPHLAASGAARKRFAREGQAAAAVVDDFVLPIYAVAEWKGVPYLVTQYSRGTTLQKRVQSDGPLEVKEILRLGMQTARGLAAAHAQGLVHRDVKPSNILLDGSVERAMLTDFGLARAVDDASITRTGVIAGTPQYMSPEQARGGSVDARSDLFSLGCVLYFLCTGHPPFRADNSYAILRLITDEEPRSIREINPDVPAWLSSIVQKLMAKRAEDRYGSASEVADILETCLAHVSNPLKNSLPVVMSRPSWRFRWNAIMSDKRILSLVAFGLFIAAFLLPWLIAAIGRDEHAMIFAGVSMLLAVTFAVVSRRESFSRIVLVMVGGAVGLIFVGVLATVPIYFFSYNQAANENRLLEQRRVEEATRAAEDARRSVEQESAMVNQNLQDSVGTTEPVLTDQRSSDSETRQTLAEAVKAFNEQSAIDRRTLFNPPIPDMTEDQLRQGFADAAKEYRDGGESHIADTLQKISETGVISTDGSIGVVLAGGISNIFQKDGTHHKDGKPETKQIAPAIVLPDGSGSHKYVALRPLELIYNRNGHSSSAYGDLYKNNEHSPKKTVTIQIPLDVSKHSGEMLEKNLNYQGLSLYAAGVMARAEGSEVDLPATVVVAHDCTLRAFEEVERNGEKFWNTTLVVPMQHELLDLRPGMTLEEAEAKFDPKAFQDRLDTLWKDGARFELDHYLGQATDEPSSRESKVQPETEKTDSPKAAVPTEETPKEMPGDDDTTGADVQEGNEANQVATTPVPADVASAGPEVPESAAPANPDAARFLGEWRLAHTFHHTTLPADAPCVISPVSIVIGSSEDHGPHKFSYTLRGEQEIDLRLFGQDGLSAPLLGRYQFQESRLFIAFNNNPDAKERPQNATMEDLDKDVALMIFEFVGAIDEDAAAGSGK
jgi:serine/threonine-protein kinase